MIIACPNCKTEYSVEEGLIDELGSKVWCAKCGHTFMAHGTIESEEPTDLAQAPASFAKDHQSRGRGEDLTEDDLLEPLDFSLFDSETDFGPPGSEEKPDGQQSSAATEQVAKETVEDKTMAAGTGVEEQRAGEEMVPPTQSMTEEEELTQEAALAALRFEAAPPTEETHAIAEDPAEEDKISAAVGISMNDIGLEQQTAPEPEIAPTEPMAEQEIEAEKQILLEQLGLTEKTDSEAVRDTAEEIAVGLREDSHKMSVEEQLMAPLTVDKGVDKSINISSLAVLIFVLVGGAAYAAYRIFDTFDIKIPF